MEPEDLPEGLLSVKSDFYLDPVSGDLWHNRGESYSWSKIGNLTSSNLSAETISFTGSFAADTQTIQWTPVRLAKFGNTPNVEVYFGTGLTKTRVLDYGETRSYNSENTLLSIILSPLTEPGVIIIKGVRSSTTDIQGEVAAQLQEEIDDLGTRLDNFVVSKSNGVLTGSFQTAASINLDFRTNYNLLLERTTGFTINLTTANFGPNDVKYLLVKNTNTNTAIAISVVFNNVIVNIRGTAMRVYAGGYGEISFKKETGADGIDFITVLFNSQEIDINTLTA